MQVEIKSSGLGMIAQIRSGVQTDKKADTTDHERKQQAQAIDDERQLDSQAGNPIDSDMVNVSEDDLRQEGRQTGRKNQEGSNW